MLHAEQFSSIWAKLKRFHHLYLNKRPSRHCGQRALMAAFKADEFGMFLG
jgi:hypothetical protein